MNYNGDYGPVATVESIERARVKAARLMAIELNGIRLGEINIDELTAGAIIDIEDAQKVSQMVDWLVAHAGADKAHVFATLRPLPAVEIVALMKQIRKAVVGSLELPNA